MARFKGHIDTLEGVILVIAGAFVGFGVHVFISGIST